MNTKDKARIQDKIMNASSLEIELVWLPGIMSKQTYDELDKGKACRKNGIGLSKVHVGFISSLYTQVLEGKHLTEKQAHYARKILRSYWKQFLGEPRVSQVHIPNQKSLFAYEAIS